MWTASLLVLYGLMFIVGADMEDFCQSQEEIFEQSASDARRHLMGMGRTSSADDMNMLCKAMLRYSDAAFDTHVVCPQNSESTSRHLVSNVNNLLDNICPNEHKLEECSRDVVGRLVGYCASTISDVQMNAQPEVICQKGGEYLECLGNVTTLCSGSQALVQANVYASIASARSSMVSFCPSEELMQGDGPVGGAPDVPANQRCSQEIIDNQLAQCDYAYYRAQSEYSPDVCRPRHLFVQCADQLRLNCPAAPLPMRVTTFREYIQLQCQDSYMTCPQGVNQGMSVAQYCLNSVGNIEENSSQYCRKMESLSGCLSGLRDVCPNNSEAARQDLDTLAARIDGVLEFLC